MNTATTSTIPTAPTGTRLTIIVVNGEMKLVHAPVNARGVGAMKLSAQLALFNLNPAHCVRLGF